MNTYRLAPSAWGVAVEVPLVGVDQAVLRTELAPRRGTQYLSISLHDDNGAWLVRLGDARIGSVTASQRARFPEVERVHRSGLVPETLAGVRFNAGIGMFGAVVFLPPSPLAVPRNGTPRGGHALPPGDMVVVDTATGDFTPSQLANLGPSQLVVGLEVVTGRVVATYGGRPLGGFSPEDSATLAALLVDAPAAPHARAFILNGMAGLDVGGPATPGEQIPALSAPAPETWPETRPETWPETWKVTDFPDGTWAVTAPLTAPPPRGRRMVREPGAADFTPTRSWSVSAGNYLTEVEKVRLRRLHDARKAGGRHRLLL
ncbi:hypothetical protein [Corynebacterium capitovis]|uniref:hypothetical protein n=1 Tax=Corynebacterium capitovis TaxID=131081 RepID=UPI0012EA1AD8|nr:hypothetical protein [Corynebacterium capitovis]